MASSSKTRVAVRRPSASTSVISSPPQLLLLEEVSRARWPVVLLAEEEEVALVELSLVNETELGLAELGLAELAVLSDWELTSLLSEAVVADDSVSPTVELLLVELLDCVLSDPGTSTLELLDVLVGELILLVSRAKSALELSEVGVEPVLLVLSVLSVLSVDPELSLESVTEIELSLIELGLALL